MCYHRFSTWRSTKQDIRGGGPQASSIICACSGSTGYYHAPTISGRTGESMCAYTTPPQSVITTPPPKIPPYTTTGSNMVVTTCPSPTSTSSQGAVLTKCGPGSSVQTLHPQPGVAHLHVWYTFETSETLTTPPNFISAEMWDTDGVVVADQKSQIAIWMDHKLTIPVSNYPQSPITIEPTYMASYKHKRTPMNVPVPPTSPSEQNVRDPQLIFQVNGFTFDTKHGSETVKGQKLPYCSVGGWAMSGLLWVCYFLSCCVR